LIRKLTKTKTVLKLKHHLLWWRWWWWKCCCYWLF